MRALQLGAATGVAAVLIAGGLLGPAMGASTVGSSTTAFGDDLSVEWVAAPPTAVIGTAVPLEVRVRNVGNAANYNVTFTVALPSSFAFSSTGFTVTPGGFTGLSCVTPADGNTGSIVCKTPNPGPTAIAAAALGTVKFSAVPLSASGTGGATFQATVDDNGGGVDSNPANDVVPRAIAVSGPPGSGNVDPGYPDFPYGGFGFGYGGYGYGGGGGYGDYDDYDDYGYGGYGDYCGCY